VFYSTNIESRLRNNNRQAVYCKSHDTNIIMSFIYL